MMSEHIALWILGIILILSSLGVILMKKPVHSSLSFLLTLLTLAAIYLQLSAQFIAVMQVLVYAGAILVIFMFVIVLFQDAYLKIEKIPSKSQPALLLFAGSVLVLGTILVAGKLLESAPVSKGGLLDGFGSVEVLGKALYIDFFFPFEAVVLLFLIAVVGSLYIGRKAE